MKPEEKIGRLALRHEGYNWNAYYALNETMEGAVPLGSIKIGAVTMSPAHKQAFMDLMRSIVSDIIEEKIGARPKWGGPETAPEHERAGSA